MLSGKVTDSTTGAPLYPATVYNASTRVASYTDSAGYYQIPVRSGQRLVFSFLGFHPQEYVVPDRLAWVLHDVQMLPKSQRLQTVDVEALTPYQQDSLARREAFGHYLDLPQAPLLDKSDGPSFGFGLVFHPFSYFSKEERRKRKFHKRYAQNEETRFVDARYRPQLVEKYTGLQGDSLQAFMTARRPSYAYTRYASRLEFLSWIIRQARLWRDSMQHAQAKITQ